MAGVGAGAREIRIHDRSGAFRVLYLAHLAEAIYVLHAFEKKTETTAKRDLDVARDRYRDLTRGRV